MNMDNNFKITDKKWDMEYQTSFYDEVQIFVNMELDMRGYIRMMQEFLYGSIKRIESYG